MPRNSAQSGQAPQPANSAPASSEFQIDLQGLIKLLAKNLYAEADVFVREMLQNAHDSVKRRRELQGVGAPEGVIRVKVDREAGTISFTDNGAGMTEQEVKDYLSTIGRSGTDAFRRNLVQKGRQADVTVIGQFGIGLLSAFIVADRVVVETLSWQANHSPWHWESSGEKTYDLIPGERQDPGSTVTLFINDNYRDMLLLEELRKAIRKYADFLPVSIYLNDDEAPANAVNAPWHKHYNNPKDEVLEMAMFVARRFPDNPLSTIPIHLSKPYKVDGVLYVSDNRIPDINTSGFVDIYQSRMFVMEANREMLPSWAKFVRGIIDSPALTLTASRDAVQQDAIQKEIKEQLGHEVIRHLTQLSKDDPTRFQQLCDWHHYHMKGMALRDDNFFRAVADLIPFETNQGPMSLSTYFEAAKSQGQSETDLLYFDERGSATQFYMLCDARKLLVVDASQVFEDDFLERYGRLHPEIKLRQLNIGESNVIFEALNPEEHKEFRQLEQEFTRGMPDRRSVAKAVRFKPESIPALSVLSAAAKNRQKLQQAGDNVMIPEEVRKLVKDVLQGERSVPVTLYLNADNPTVQQLAKMPPSEDKIDACMAIYNNSIMLINQVLTAGNAEVIFKSFSRVIDRMITQTDRAQKLEGQITKLRLQIDDKDQELRAQVAAQNDSQTEHISCFVAMPFDDKFKPLLEALKMVLEDKPYGWEVIRADSKLLGLTISANVEAHIARSHCYLADISDKNPNVFLEIGAMGHYKGRPLIYLCREDAQEEIAADLQGNLYHPYSQWDLEKPDIETLAQQLRSELERRPDLDSLKHSATKTFLSANVLVRNNQCDRPLAEKISKTYKTVEAFLAASSEDIATTLNLTRNAEKGAIADAQDFLKKHFGL
ncbi:ATP-binding protein [Nodosilinea sp. PGN35]|uniref:heat shock protein Hsp90 family protein n=1 Tax=Nodosilinea sp. PGN35 TaxID=3020489 RepID=UPI0023B2F55C|nr:ATP-binding protein [Nodosilinea sp. TSF1-S3]MDF0366574.1 ATP-binding protein [Nodosilinea sp. TSF1-S3]